VIGADIDQYLHAYKSLLALQVILTAMTGIPAIEELPAPKEMTDKINRLNQPSTLYL
jgi:hypothetical protein